MLDLFVPDEVSLDDSSDEEEDDEVAREMKPPAKREDEFFLKVYKETQLPSGWWLPDNMHPMVAGDLGTIFSAMLQSHMPSARPSTKQVSAQFMEVATKLPHS